MISVVIYPAELTPYFHKPKIPIDRLRERTHQGMLTAMSFPIDSINYLLSNSSMQMMLPHGLEQWSYDEKEMLWRGSYSLQIETHLKSSEDCNDHRWLESTNLFSLWIVEDFTWESGTLYETSTIAVDLKFKTCTIR